jgi:hypothetical protein
MIVQLDKIREDNLLSSHIVQILGFLRNGKECTHSLENWKVTKYTLQGFLLVLQLHFI